MKQIRPPGNYGIDAPYLLIVPAVLVLAGLAQFIVTRQAWSILGALLVLLFSGFGYYANRRGKFIVWSRILNDLHMRGDEDILDLGCGRGAILILAAERLTTGRAVGVDLWRASDQSGNAINVTIANAKAAGVADRVEVQTSDMTHLPFADSRFDIVVSNLALHNLKPDGQNQAIDEAKRVLKPGGHLLIADLHSTNHYMNRLRDDKMNEIAQSNLGWRMWWSGPWLATRLVTAAKPLS